MWREQHHPFPDAPPPRFNRRKGKGVSGSGLGSSATMRGRRIAITTAAAVLVSVAGCSTGPVHGVVVENGSGHVVTLADHGQARGTLKIASGATAIMIGTANSNGPLVRASTPTHSDVRPVIKRGRVIRVALRHAADGTASTGTTYIGTANIGAANIGAAHAYNNPATLRVYLNDAVRWRLVIGGGADGLVLNLRSAHLRAADIVAGFSAITMRLPHPAGTGIVRLAAGASRVRVVVPPGVPSRLALNGGAGYATIAGRTYTGVAGGTVLTAPGWTGAIRRYQINAPAGLASISVSSASTPSS